jgi:hypothetical protein
MKAIQSIRGNKMHTIVTRGMFIDSFISIRPERYSYSGLCALFDYLDDMGAQDVELDVIAICCEFSQYTLEEALAAYNLESIEDLEENTTVIDCGDGTIIIQDF